ncbi:MAG: hypothetical protein HZB30_02665 [Nitrospirae bacterium]|nr:hypothetical protein [Nitrospirota bacterium]
MELTGGIDIKWHKIGKMVIDARGLGYQKPLIMAEEALSTTDDGIVEMLVDNEH